MIVRDENYENESKLVGKLVEEENLRDLMERFWDISGNSNLGWLDNGEEMPRTYALYADAMRDLMGKDQGLSEDEAKVVWDKVWDDGRRLKSGDIYVIYSNFQDIANTVLSLKDGLREAWKKKDERMEGRDSEENLEEEDELER